MTIPGLLRGATAITGGLLLALTGFAQAQAATATRWRVDTVITLRGGSFALSSVVATSKTDAWSAGIIFSESGSKAETRILVEHFDGRWRQFPVPTRLQAVSPDARVLIGASSASNAWIFELRTGHAQRILRWNGHRWIVMSTPAWVFRGGPGGSTRAAVAVFRNTAWVFSLGASSMPSDAALYAHGRWTLAKLPAIPTSVAAVSANNIWASGPTDSFSGPVIMHWNGRSWTEDSVPGLDWDGSIASDSPNSAWLLTATSLEFWNGAAWTAISLPSGLGLTLISTDGHGGVWLWGPHEVGAGIFTPYVFAHYNDGTWTQQNAPQEDGNNPVPLAAMAQAPGSTTDFAAGWVSITNGRTSGAILQYGG